MFTDETYETLKLIDLGSALIIEDKVNGTIAECYDNEFVNHKHHLAVRNCGITPTYCPPEVTEEHNYNYTWDHYGLGCCILALLTGLAPEIKDEIKCGKEGYGIEKLWDDFGVQGISKEAKELIEHLLDPVCKEMGHAAAGSRGARRWELLQKWKQAIIETHPKP